MLHIDVLQKEISGWNGDVLQSSNIKNLDTWDRTCAVSKSIEEEKSIIHGVAVRAWYLEVIALRIPVVERSI